MQASWLPFLLGSNRFEEDLSDELYSSLDEFTFRLIDSVSMLTLAQGRQGKAPHNLIRMRNGQAGVIVKVQGLTFCSVLGFAVLAADGDLWFGFRKPQTAKLKRKRPQTLYTWFLGQPPHIQLERADCSFQDQTG